MRGLFVLAVGAIRHIARADGSLAGQRQEQDNLQRDDQLRDYLCEEQVAVAGYQDYCKSDSRPGGAGPRDPGESHNSVATIARTLKIIAETEATAASWDVLIAVQPSSCT